MAGFQPSALRCAAFRLCVVVFALGYGVLLSLVLGLLGPAWDTGGSETIHRIHHLGSVIFIALILIGLLAQLRRPEKHPAAFQQAALAVVALVITSLIVGDPDNHGSNVGVIDLAMLVFVAPVGILVMLHPARRELLRLKLQTRPASVGIAILSSIPFVAYAVDQALLQRNSWPPAADPHHNGHWMAMAMMALAIPLVGLLASLTRDDWHIPAWSAGAAAISFGLGSVLMPELASSIGRVWGILSIVGSILFIGVVSWETRHVRSSAVFIRTLRQPGE